MESKPVVVAHPCSVNRWIIIWYIKTRVLIIFDPTRFSVAGWTHSRCQNARHCGCRTPAGACTDFIIIINCTYTVTIGPMFTHTMCRTSVSIAPGKRLPEVAIHSIIGGGRGERKPVAVLMLSAQCDGLTLRCAENCTRNLEFGKHARRPFQNNMSMSGNQRVIRGFATSRTE